MTTTAMQHSDSASPTINAGLWVENHGDYLFRFALGQVEDPTTAEDLVQETFLAAMRAKDRFAGQSTERTWLTSILRHKIYDHLRQLCARRMVPLNTTGERQDEDHGDVLFWLHEVAAECAAPGRRMEFRASLEKALSALPERVEQVFRLYQIEELPGRVVCEKMGITESNLWVIMHRARKTLREELQNWRDYASPSMETVPA